MSSDVLNWEGFVSNFANKNSSELDYIPLPYMPLNIFFQAEGPISQPQCSADSPPNPHKE